MRRLLRYLIPGCPREAISDPNLMRSLCLMAIIYIIQMKISLSTLLLL